MAVGMWGAGHVGGWECGGMGVLGELRWGCGGWSVGEKWGSGGLPIIIGSSRCFLALQHPRGTATGWSRKGIPRTLEWQVVAVTCASTSEQIIWVLWGNAALLGSQVSLSPLTPLTLPFGPLSQAEGSVSPRQRRDVKQGLAAITYSRVGWPSLP